MRALVFGAFGAILSCTSSLAQSSPEKISSTTGSRPRRRDLPPDLGERQATAVATNALDRSFQAAAPNRKWIAGFTYVWTAEDWLHVAAVVDLFSRRVLARR